VCSQKNELWVGTWGGKNNSTTEQKNKALLAGGAPEILLAQQTGGREGKSWAKRGQLGNQANTGQGRTGRGSKRAGKKSEKSQVANGYRGSTPNLGGWTGRVWK